MISSGVNRKTKMNPVVEFQIIDLFLLGNQVKKIDY